MIVIHIIDSAFPKLAPQLNGTVLIKGHQVGQRVVLHAFNESFLCDNAVVEWLHDLYLFLFILRLFSF